MNRFSVKRISGRIKVPGDKSISHRAVILGSIAKGTTRIKNLLESEDVLHTVGIFRALGVKIEKISGTYYIQGKGLYGLSEPDNILDAGNSGTTIRLVSGILSAQPFLSIITGDDSLKNRPMRRIIEPLSKMGAKIFGRDNNRYPPLVILGNKRIRGIKYRLPVASAQVKSSILFAGLYSKSRVIIIEPEISRDHTEKMFEYLKIPIEKKSDRIILNNKGKDFSAKDISVPGDISSASYFIAAALLKNGNKVTIENVGINPTRMGFVNILKKMGANIRINNQKLVNNERVGDITAEYSELKSIEIGATDVPLLIDEIPLLAIVSLIAKGETVIRGAEELRHKESDRIHSIVHNLKKLGVKIEEFKDGFKIKPVKKLKENVIINSFNDHRIVMSFIIASILFKKGIRIDNIDAISISYPSFLKDLKKVERGKY